MRRATIDRGQRPIPNLGKVRDTTQGRRSGLRLRLHARPLATPSSICCPNHCVIKWRGGKASIKRRCRSTCAGPSPSPSLGDRSWASWGNDDKYSFCSALSRFLVARFLFPVRVRPSLYLESRWLLSPFTPHLKDPLCSNMKFKSHLKSRFKNNI